MDEPRPTIQSHFAFQEPFAEKLKGNREIAAVALGKLGIPLTDELWKALQEVSYEELVKMQALMRAGAEGANMLAWP